MQNEITIDDLLELEAFADGLKDKARKIREKMENQKPRKRRGVSEAEMAQVLAKRLKVMYKK